MTIEATTRMKRAGIWITALLSAATLGRQTVGPIWAHGLAESDAIAQVAQLQSWRGQQAARNDAVTDALHALDTRLARMEAMLDLLVREQGAVPRSARR